MRLATKTLEAIDAKMKEDQGASYRDWLGKVIGHIGDAYDGRKAGSRSHLGASMIGRECERSLWYGFHWVKKPSFEGRLLRLFNRGHLEEARFIALLLMIGCQVYQQDANGKQFRISDAGGHFGGSCDGICVGCPDVPEGVAVLTEFKTHNDNSFKKLIAKGVKEAKPEHFIQMCVYMQKLGLTQGLYLAVNKNDDALHAELVDLDNDVATKYIERGRKIVWMNQAPARINDSAGFFQCRMCDYADICHFGGEVELNCRTCRNSKPTGDGEWFCGKHKEVLPVELQRQGCVEYERSGEI